MIYLVSGENVYACEARLKSLLDEHGSDDLSTSSVDMSEPDSLETLASRLQGSSLFSESETTVLRYLEDVKAVQEKALDLIKETPESNQLIVYIPGVKGTNPLVKKLAKIADKNFLEGELNEHELSNWLVDEAKKRGGKLNTAIARNLVDYVGHDQMSLSNELDKLIAYNKNITKESIAEVAVPSPRTTIFQMLDAMMQGRSEKAMSYLNDLKTQQFDENYIISMIAWQAHSLSVAVAAKGKNQTEVAKKAGVSPYVMRKASDIAKNLSKKDVIELNEYILKTDVELKTAPTDKEQLIEQLIRRVAFIQS